MGGLGGDGKVCVLLCNSVPSNFGRIRKGSLLLTSWLVYNYNSILTFHARFISFDLVIPYHTSHSVPNGHNVFCSQSRNEL